MVPLQLGLDFVALGLVIAFVLVFVGMLSQMSGSLGGGGSVSMGDRRGFLKGVIGLGVAGYLVAVLGGTAVDELSNVCTVLNISPGESWTVATGEVETFCGVENNGELIINGQLEVTEGE